MHISRTNAREGGGGGGGVEHSQHSARRVRGPVCLGPRVTVAIKNKRRLF